jgi:hypothetical protein
MKGIYLSQEGLQEIENEIKNLKANMTEEPEDRFVWALAGRIVQLEEIIFEATILPVEESWDKVIAAPLFCKNGVIIKSKEQ